MELRGKKTDFLGNAKPARIVPAHRKAKVVTRCRQSCAHKQSPTFTPPKLGRSTRPKVRFTPKETWEQSPLFRLVKDWSSSQLAAIKCAANKILHGPRHRYCCAAMAVAQRPR
jgi:hypothetical protein